MIIIIHKSTAPGKIELEKFVHVGCVYEKVLSRDDRVTSLDEVAPR